MKWQVTTLNQAMKYIDEYRKKDLILGISDEIRKISKKEISLMEVCGGHTMAIHRFGLNSLLPPNIHLLSGPGCPVCVSGQHFIDTSIAYSKLPGLIITTYGDLIRVPGSASSLEKEKAKGQDIRIVYSVLESLEIAGKNPEKKVVFLGIGFETTAPLTAAAIVEAKKREILNFSVLSAHKVMPPVMKALVMEGVKINGFIAPGHVTAITGTGIYRDLPEKFGLGVVVSGFEPLDMMQSVLMLVNQIEAGKPKIEIQYLRVVQKKGNPIARTLMNKVFELKDDNWRGLGLIPLSGLKIRPGFSAFDAEKLFPLEVPAAPEPKGCICGMILRGLKTPPDCRLFEKKCTPADPVGACMVSGEGTCSTYYKYRS
ncbi:MAG: hydrogenase formation protein HypD [Bacteroidetes bacterium]|nr:hydrogenase formation protein HypD [Bacteroidota bacterium]